MEQRRVVTVEGLGVSYKKWHLSTLKSSVLRWWRGDPLESFWALREVDLEVHDDEILGIIGRNGSGKSTLMQVLAGTLEPSEGFAEVRGKPTPLLSLAFGGNPELSGLENITIMAMYLGLDGDQIDAVIPRVIEFSELGDFINEPMRTFSSGMMSRLGFSLAINVEPDILLLDEVLGVGDEAFKEKCQRAMQDLVGRSRAVIVVTHSLPFVTENCTRALWLDEGSVRALGPARDVVAQYKESLVSERRGVLRRPENST